MANLTEKCMQLSCKIAELGKGINGRRAAQILFAQLTEAGVELGAGVSMMGYLPARSMRSGEAIELIKISQKIIYMLRLALAQKMFLSGATAEALNCAVYIANDITQLVRQYSQKGAGQAAVRPAAQPPHSPAVQPRPETRQGAAGEVSPVDPDGFNAIYNGKI